MVLILWRYDDGSKMDYVAQMARLLWILLRLLVTKYKILGKYSVHGGLLFERCKTYVQKQMLQLSYECIDAPSTGHPGISFFYPELAYWPSIKAYIES